MSETLRKDLHEENRRAWNLATEVHNSHKADQAGFLRRGGSTLFPEERALLGDLSGKRLLHLQCNAGQDTLSLAQLGAVVTGVDISDTAILFARRLSAESGIPGEFQRADIYDWLAATAEADARFDVVFSSYGALTWLSDLSLWARGVERVLAPGGRLVVVEFHPVAFIFDEHWQHTYPYFRGGQPDRWESGVGDYVALSGPALAPSGYLEGVQGFVNPYPGNDWTWTIGEILGAVTGAGLAITSYQEFPYSNGATLWADMQPLPGGRMIPPDSVPNLPLMYGLSAERR